MSDIYGSGLTFDRAGGGEAPPGSPQVSDAAEPPMQPDTPAPQAPPAQPQQAEGPAFGSSLRKMTPGAHYDAPDPQASALDQASSLLEQRVKRASSIATNPLAQIFAPEQVAAARQFVPQAAEQLQKIEQQKSAIQAGRVQARTLGLDPGEVSDQATQEDRITIAQSKALKGDMRAFQGLQAVHPERAAAIAPQVYETVAGHLDRAQLAFDSLASMQNEGQYRAKVNQLRQDGTLTDLESLGLKLPPTFEAFNASKAMEGRALREARIGINTIGQKLEERNTYQPMEKKEAETYHGRLTTAYGDKLTNGQWGRNGASGTRGLVVNGLPTVDALGRGGVIGDKEQRKELGEDFKNAVPKEDIEKLRAFNRTYQLATTDAKGKPVPDGKINTNPNVQQGISEGLASMLRGGTGGANVGLLKIELGKRGWAQSAIDGLVSNYAGTMNTLFKNADRPYLSEQTQKQIRDVMDVLKTYSEQDISERGKDIARRAGALGFDVSALGLSKNEASGVIGEALEEGRRAQIERMRPNFQAIGGGDGVLQLGAQRPGASSSDLPLGSQQANQLPGARPLQTPVQQAGQPPQQSGPTPQASPGVQQPVTIAGQQVTLPPGISPQYVQAVQRIESGGERDPWKAGTKLSSASGAFQFIKSTWAADKPPGSPERAADATPQQQAEALASRATKDTGTLKANNLPVTDTSLYVMHNLGAGAGATLLKADPSADARTLVGEDAARNNPMFFKGRPTVATVLQRYADAMNEPEGGPKPKPDFGGATVSDAADVVGKALLKSFPPTAALSAIWGRLSPDQKEKVKELAIDNAPAIGSIAGGVAGAAAGNIPGGVAGGAAGGAAGQALKDYLKGNAQSPKEIVKQGAIGGVLGVMPAGRPVVGAAARVLGVSGVEAADKVAEGGDASDAVDAGLKGAGLAVGGEMFGRALGMAGHKVYNLFSPDARKTVQTAAKNYAEAAEALRTEPSKLPGTGGAASTTNPKYEAAEAAKTKAEATLKDAGLNPEEAAYAHKVSAEGVPTQEAEAARPGALEKERVGEGYQQLEREVGGKGVGAPKATPKLADGPVAAVEAKKVSAAHAELAEHVEMAITAPAKNWQEKWTQLKDARSDLLQAERDALSSTAPGKTKIANDMRTLADTVRAQQEKSAQHVFGKRDGELFMLKLNVLDARYRRLMDATNGMDLAKAARMTGEAGREAEKRFTAFAAGDKDAVAAFRAMRGAKGDAFESTVPWTVAGEGLPVVGKVIKVAKLGGMLREWARERAAGSPVTFADLVKTPDYAKEWQSVRDIVGAAGARAVVQGTTQ